MREMDNLDALVRGDHQVNGEKPPPRTCPRCNSDNTRFSYYNNYSLAQPRYTCKNCRRLWTHGGTLKNIPAGGSEHKTKRQRIDQASVAQVVPVETQHVHHNQPVLHDQETNDFRGSIGGSSSAAAAVFGNYFGSLPENQGDMVFPVQTHQPMDGSFHQGYYHVGSSDVVYNPFTNQSIGGHVNNYNSYRVSQDDQNKPRQSFDSTMTMNHNASPSGSS